MSNRDDITNGTFTEWKSEDSPPNIKKNRQQAMSDFLDNTPIMKSFLEIQQIAQKMRGNPEEVEPGLIRLQEIFNAFRRYIRNNDDSSQNTET